MTDLELGWITQAKNGKVWYSLSDGNCTYQSFIEDDEKEQLLRFLYTRANNSFKDTEGEN